MRLTSLLTTLALAAAIGSGVFAQSAKDYFEPLVNHQQFATLLRDLNLTREQRMVVELVFTDYLDAIEQLATEADRAADQAGRRRVNDALSGRAIVDPAELRRLRLAVLDVYESYLDRVDREFDNLMFGIESMLVGEQASKIESELRALRRAVLLHPRHKERTFHEYAGDGVDVLLLVKEATSEGGELEGVERDSIAAILEQYERDLDRLLIETSHAHRLSRMQLRKARISRDARDLREAEQKAIEQWNRMYSLNDRAVQQIGEVAAAHPGGGPVAVDRWRQRFHRASFEWMFSRQGPDRQFEWLMQQRLADEQRAEAQAIYDDYLAKRFVLAGRAITLMVRARAELGSIIYSMMDPTDLTGQKRNIYDDLLRNSGEMATLDAATSNAFEDLLDTNQRRTFRDAFRRR